MKSDPVMIIALGVLTLVQSWWSIIVLKSAWRSWNRPMGEAPPLLRLQQQLAKRLLGGQRYEAGMAFNQRQSIRRLHAVISIGVSVLVLLLSILYIVVIVSELLKI